MEYQKGGDDWLVRATILKKLFLSRRIGGKHLPFRFVIQGLPNRFHNLSKKLAKKMVSEGLLLSKISTGEEHISINPSRTKEVIEIVERVFPDLRLS